MHFAPTALYNSLKTKFYSAKLNRQISHYDRKDAKQRRLSIENVEDYFFKLVAAFSPDLFVEAGAKDASTSRRARSHLDKARIVAFEANPYTYKRFSSHDYSSEGVEYLNLALSDEVGVSSFNVRKRADGKLHADGRGSLLTRDDHPHGHQTVEIATTTLDSFLSDFDYKSCALWVDLEGAAGLALKGAVETLRKTAVVFIEVEDRSYWDGQWLCNEVMEFLCALNLVPVGRDIQSKNQFNIVFVHKALATGNLCRQYHREFMAKSRRISS